MKKNKLNTLIVVVCIFINIIFVNATPETTRKKLSVENENFLKEFIPLAEQANKEVLKERLGLVLIKYFYNFTHTYTPKSVIYINELAVKYKTDTLSSNFENFEDVLNDLLYKIDEIPVKMVTAQAILESGWGRSKAARKTNNFFGLTSKSANGKYFVTHNENTNTTLYLKSYSNVEDGIKDFIYTINTHFAYDKFRQLRETHRDANESLNATELTKGISRYSEMGGKYIAKINIIINKYIPENIDHY